MSWLFLLWLFALLLKCARLRPRRSSRGTSQEVASEREIC
jgi:hypothetical protein